MLLVSLIACLIPAPLPQESAIEGRFEFVDRLYDAGGFTGVHANLPVRFADVEILDAATGQVLAATKTNANGSFQAVVWGTGTVDLQVACFPRADLAGYVTEVKLAAAPSQDLSIRSAIYVGWEFGHDLSVGVLTSPILSLTNCGGPGGNRSANPFHSLDLFLSGVEYLQSFGHSPLDGTPTTIFLGNLDGAGSCGGGGTANNTVIRLGWGLWYNDSDELHEIGHHLFQRFGAGLTHDAPPPPFGAVWCSTSNWEADLVMGRVVDFFSACVRNHRGDPNPSLLLRAMTAGSGAGLVLNSLDLEDSQGCGNLGTNDLGLGSLAATWGAVWDIFDTAAMNGGQDDDLLDGSVTFTDPGGNPITGEELLWTYILMDEDNRECSGESIAEAFLVPHDYGNWTRVARAFSNFGILFKKDALEPNDCFEEATPLVVDGGWSGTLTFFTHEGPKPFPNVRDKDFFSIEVSEGQCLVVETRYPGGPLPQYPGTKADPLMVLYGPLTGPDPCGPIVDCHCPAIAVDDDSGVGRNAKIVIDAAMIDHYGPGTWYVKVQGDSDCPGIAGELGKYEVEVRTCP